MILILISVDGIIQGCEHIDYFIEFHGDYSDILNISYVVIQNKIVVNNGRLTR